eukprot:TRINITY_DN29521_c0_g1_i1.p1 TRINITY_DN29521_c0_g1~~TRINITY_DN29521_c0_g1_i1.p1  ORF type:complete len:1126 (-),score=205.89 TRINITY_DN29521_c0_g1_i1:76-3453(-)
MASFSLLSVLGSGSPRLACHSRFPVAAYQAGSVLVIWDYTRSGEESRKFVLLQPNQRCAEIFFSKDAQCILGVWLAPSGQPTLTVWRTADGAKLAEHRLSDTATGLPVWADYHSETEHLLLVHGSSVLSACVARWEARALSPQHLAHGHLGNKPAKGLVAVRLVEDGRHFALAEGLCVQFWSYAGAPGPPRQVLRVDLGKALKAFELQGRLAYLLPEAGKLQLMNFEGQREQVAATPPSARPSAVQVQSSMVCLGCEDGSLLVCRSSSPDHWNCVPCPAELCQFGYAPAVVSLTIGMNEDYTCVCFADATHGVVHIDSGRYVALRAGHVGALQGLVMAPQLRMPAALAGRLLDAERILQSKALAFLSLGAQGPDALSFFSSAGFIAWPKQGPPARGFLAVSPQPPEQSQGYGHDDMLLESFMPRGPSAPSSASPMEATTAAAFHPAASLAADGSFSGAYALLAGSVAGSLQLLEAEADDGSGGIAWRTTRVRPLSAEASDQAANNTACCHLDFSRCGYFVLSTFSSAAVEMLQFPLLTRAVMLQSAVPLASRTPGSSVEVQKAFFVWQPTLVQRNYDKNLYAVSHAETSQDVVLYEIYPLGEMYAKASKAVFQLPVVCKAAGGTITDFSAHPSQMYLVVTAALPAADTRSIVLVYDLWSGELLKSCAIFTSLLVAPLLPLRPMLCIDASGAYLFCASTPTVVAPMDVQLAIAKGLGSSTLKHVHGVAQCSDMLHTAWNSLTDTPSRVSQQTTSVVCIVDFSSGEQIYQASLDVSCLALGSPWHDPCQLLVGAPDGTISVWRPPASVTERVSSILQESQQAYSKLAKPSGLQGASPSPSTDIEDAVAWHWATMLSTKLDWKAWGEVGLHKAEPVFGAAAVPAGNGLVGRGPHSEPLPLLPLPPPRQEAFPRSSPDDDGDVVLQARKHWPQPGAAQSIPHLDPWLASPVPASAQPPAAPLRQQSLAKCVVGMLEIDPDSGLEVQEVPGGLQGLEPLPQQLKRMPGDGAVNVAFSEPQSHWQGTTLPEWRRPPEPAELLVAAPELREEFGTSSEHFQDPLPSEHLGGSFPELGKPLPRWLEQGRPSMLPGGGRDFVLAQSVLSELDSFELANPQAQAVDSPRSTAGAD